MPEDIELGRGWHLDKRISLTHLFTTGTVVVAMVLWSARMEGRDNLIEERVERNTQDIQTLNGRVDDQYKEIIRRLESIDSKAARHLEEHARGG